MHSSKLLLAATICLTLLSACSGPHAPGSSEPSDRTFLTQQLAGLERLPAPENVEQQIWSELKEALRSVLTARLQSGKSVRAVADGDASRTWLSLDESSSTLSWHYYNQGDYDQNGEVNISDLSALAAQLGEKTSGGPFPVDTVQSAVDGDGNGQINVSDITPLGANLGNRVRSYNVYTALPWQLPKGENTDTTDEDATELAALALAEAIGPPSAGRLRFEFQLADLPPGALYFVRPSEAGDGSGQEGTPSNVAGPPQGDFVLEQLPITSYDAGTGSLQLRVEYDPGYDNLMAIISTNDATNLKGYAFRISYPGASLKCNPELFELHSDLNEAELSPDTAVFATTGKTAPEPVQIFGPGEVDFLAFSTSLSDPVYVGFSGSTDLVEIHFDYAPETASERSYSTIGLGSSSPWAVAEVNGASLQWRYRPRGDCDQNGVVDMFDAILIFAHVGTDLTQESPTSHLWAVSGDQNTEINISDLTPLIQNLGTRVDGWNIYGSALESDYPDNGILDVQSPIAFESSLTDPTQELRMWEVTLPAGSYYWTRALYQGIEGGSSTMAQQGP